MTATIPRNDMDGLVDRIYEASIIPELWPEVLRDFAFVLDSKEAAIVAVSEKVQRWVTSSPACEELARKSFAYPGGVERSLRLMELELSGFATESDVYTHEEMLAEPLYSDYLIPSGYGRGIATAIAIPTGESIIFHAEGDYSQGPVGPELMSLANRLRPHLARSALLSARLSFERAQTAVATLAGLGLAACAATQDGKVLVANREFDVESALWTTRGGDRVALFDKRADAQLAQALSRIDAAQGVLSMPLLAQGPGSPAVLHVIPVRRTAFDLFHRATAILVLTTASEVPLQANSLLRALFDLTPTEAVLAARIAAGQTSDSIALEDSKTIGTVRNQLKSVLTKTGCRRQADLARLLAQLVPGNR